MSEDKAVLDKTYKLVKVFFEYIREVYVDQLPSLGKFDKEETYISYPVKWPDYIRDVMVNIAIEAGFDNVSGVDEPTAALNSLLHQYHKTLIEEELFTSDESCKIMMLDMGAGTTDLVVCEYTPSSNQSLNVLLTCPLGDVEDYFGGREIDERLTDYCIDYLKKHEIDYSKHKIRAMRKVKLWKEYEFSKVLNKNKTLPGRPPFLNEIINSNTQEPFHIVDRDSFEIHLDDLLKVFPKIINDCAVQLKEWSLFDKIDLIILTGGNSQWYFIEEYLKGIKGDFAFEKIIRSDNRVLRMTRPQETVAYGLTLNKHVMKNIEKKIKPKEKVVYTNVKTRSKGKPSLRFKTIKSLQMVVNLVNETALAIGDPTRVLEDSSIKDVIAFAATGAGITSGISLIALFSLGIPGITGAALTSGLATAGAIAGGTLIGGAFILAAPIAIVGIGGGLLKAALNKKKLMRQLHDEKLRLVIDIDKKVGILKKSIRELNPSNKDRRKYLVGLEKLLLMAKKDLEYDIQQVI